MKGERYVMFNLDSTSVFIAGDENEYEMDVKPTIKDGRTYLPIRAICELFNKKIKYSENTGFKKIEIEEGGL